MPLEIASSQRVLIEETVGILDQRIARQINIILHHPRLQKLEASWRGLKLIATDANRDKRVKLKLLNLSASELSKDLLNATEPDQSHLFRHIYTDGLDTPGSEPFGLLIGDYYFSHKPEQGIKDGPGVLKALGQISAAAFCPFVAGLSPRLMGIDHFGEYPIHTDSHLLFQQKEYQRWTSMQKTEELRFVNLAMPRFILRPNIKTTQRARQRFFNEDSYRSATTLWGNPAYLIGCCTINCFIETGWFGALSGHQLSTCGHQNPYLRHRAHCTDPTQILKKSITELLVTDRLERQISSRGYICIKDNPWQNQIGLFNYPSIHMPHTYSKDVATTNAKISSTLNYMLCVSRFAHYIKIIAREKVGSFINAKACQDALNQWLRHYITTSATDSEQILAKYPLSDARVEITAKPGLPGEYNSIIHIKPHYQLDSMGSHLKLVTDIRLN